MARRRRGEEYGQKYHVMNRGVARRTIFDHRSDYRFFLAGLARATRRGEIEVLSYALMRTHFHLFLRSLGGMSEAMRRVQQRHARRFNRMHRRDGPLMRNRFLSCCVRNATYSARVVRYIHENPVVARLCTVPTEYPWSSAGRLARGPAPRWLHLGELRRCGGLEAFGVTDSPERMRARADLMEARLRAPAELDDAGLDDSTPTAVVTWMRRKALLADGAVTALPLVPRRPILAMLEHFEAAAAAHTSVPGAGTYPTLELLRVGILRDAAATSYTEISALTGDSPSRVRRLYRHHQRCLASLHDYEVVVSTALKGASGLL